MSRNFKAIFFGQMERIQFSIMLKLNSSRREPLCIIRSDNFQSQFRKQPYLVFEIASHIQPNHTLIHIPRTWFESLNPFAFSKHTFIKSYLLLLLWRLLFLSFINNFVVDLVFFFVRCGSVWFEYKYSFINIFLFMTVCENIPFQCCRAAVRFECI